MLVCQGKGSQAMRAVECVTYTRTLRDRSKQVDNMLSKLYSAVVAVQHKPVQR